MLNLEDSVKAVIQVFSVVVGLALQRFLVERYHLIPAKTSLPAQSGTEREEPDPKTDRMVYWSCFVILVSLILRFVIGSSAHLYDTYVTYGQDLSPGWVIVRFLKDLAFLIAFGVVLVKLALSRKGSFPAWLMGFLGVAIVWSGIEIPIEHVTGKKTHFGWLWLIINGLSLLLTWLLSKGLKKCNDTEREKRAFRWLAVVFAIVFVLDLAGIMKYRHLPKPPEHENCRPCSTTPASD